MKSVFVKAIPFSVFMMLGVNAYSQKVYELSDLSGSVNVTVSVDEGNVAYSVSKDGEVMIRKSPVSMSISNGDVWGKDAKVKRVKRRSVDEDIFPPLYRKDKIENEYNEMTISFKDGYSLIFRAFEDGVAYRFASDMSKPFNVVSEEASFNLPDDSKVYAAFPKGRMNEGKEDPFYSSFQNTYEYMSLKEWNNGKFAMTPLLVETKSGKKLCITEADLLNYPGMFLQNNEAKDGLQGVFAKYPKKIVPELTYREMDFHSIQTMNDNVYSFLLFTGYLKIKSKVENDHPYTYELVIPNKEVKYIYEDIFMKWFDSYQRERKGKFIDKLIKGEVIEAIDLLNDVLESSISYYDSLESFYHGFMVGFLQETEYEIQSNKESGEGRFDIALLPRRITRECIILECKHSKSVGTLIQDSQKAADQIVQKGYREIFIRQGYPKILGYGISFYKKQCFITKAG